MISDRAISLLTEFEGFRSVAYDDKQPKVVLRPGDKLLGVLTIGYGHTGKDVYIGQTISKEMGALLLKEDLERFSVGVQKAVKDVPTTQNQFEAMVILAYNIGLGAFNGNCSVRIGHIMKDYAKAERSFKLWNKQGKTVLPALVRRRYSEALLYSKEEYDPLYHVKNQSREWELYYKSQVSPAEWKEYLSKVNR